MADQTPEELEAQIHALIRRGRLIEGEIAESQQELKDVKKTLVDVLPDGWSATIDGKPVRKSPPNRKFSPKRAIALLSDEERKSIIERMVNEKKLRDLIEEKGLLEECMEAGEGQHSMKL
jgi:hypothetical protein